MGKEGYTCADVTHSFGFMKLERICSIAQKQLKSNALQQNSRNLFDYGYLMKPVLWYSPIVVFVDCKSSFSLHNLNCLPLLLRFLCSGDYHGNIRQKRAESLSPLFSWLALGVYSLFFVNYCHLYWIHPFDVLFLGKIQICKFRKRKEFCRFQTHDRQLGLTPAQ